MMMLEGEQSHRNERVPCASLVSPAMYATLFNNITNKKCAGYPGSKWTYKEPNTDPTLVLRNLAEVDML